MMQIHRQQQNSIYHHDVTADFLLPNFTLTLLTRSDNIYVNDNDDKVNDDDDDDMVLVVRAILRRRPSRGAEMTVSMLC